MGLEGRMWHAGLGLGTLVLNNKATLFKSFLNNELFHDII
jgi:hypothetical protein